MSDFKTQLASMSPDQQGEFLDKLPAALAAKSQSEQLLKKAGFNSSGMLLRFSASLR